MNVYHSACATRNNTRSSPARGAATLAHLVRRVVPAARAGDRVLRGGPVPAGGTIPNPLPFAVNYQMSASTGGGWEEVGVGIVPVGGSIPVPLDPDLCGREICIIVWDF